MLWLFAPASGKDDNEHFGDNGPREQGSVVKLLFLCKKQPKDQWHACAFDQARDDFRISASELEAIKHSVSINGRCFFGIFQDQSAILCIMSVAMNWELVNVEALSWGEEVAFMVR